MPGSLTARRPTVGARELVEEFVPPPHFAAERFTTYVPDPAQGSQQAALTALQAFAARIARPGPGRRAIFRRSAPPEGRAGVYLDGGFGVGKTHLLASLWREVPGPKYFGTFVEFTNLVGALGFRRAVDVLSAARLVCIDEFELDDPGDTVLMSTLLGELVGSGVHLAATSNTLPDRLGEGRFAADDFLREIQALAAHFDVLRIDGDDYRHRGLPEAPESFPDDAVAPALAAVPGAVVDDFDALIEHLVRVHPSQYGALVDGVGAVGLRGVRPLDDQAAALRLVVLVDRLYDRDIPVVVGGVRVDRIFTADLLRGGYRKKYFRAISRLVSLARQGRAVLG